MKISFFKIIGDFKHFRESSEELKLHWMKLINPLMTGVKSLILVNYDATDKEINLFRTIIFTHAQFCSTLHCNCNKNSSLYCLFLLSFIVSPISSRIKTTFQHLSFKSVSPNCCESSLISRLAECSQVFPWTAPVAGTRTRKLSAASGGRWAATRASNDPSRRLREDFTIMEKTPTRAFSWLKVSTNTFTFKTLC